MNHAHYFHSFTQIKFQADSLHLDILYMAKTGAGLLQSYGQPSYDKCQEVRSCDQFTAILSHEYFS